MQGLRIQHRIQVSHDNAYAASDMVPVQHCSETMTDSDEIQALQSLVDLWKANSRKEHEYGLALGDEITSLRERVMTEARGRDSARTERDRLREHILVLEQEAEQLRAEIRELQARSATPVELAFRSLHEAAHRLGTPL